MEPHGNGPQKADHRSHMETDSGDLQTALKTNSATGLFTTTGDHHNSSSTGFINSKISTFFEKSNNSSCEEGENCKNSSRPPRRSQGDKSIPAEQKCGAVGSSCGHVDENGFISFDDFSNEDVVSSAASFVQVHHSRESLQDNEERYYEVFHDAFLVEGAASFLQLKKQKSVRGKSDYFESLKPHLHIDVVHLIS